jgi:BolA protein
MTRAERIKASLAIFAPSALIVEDESAKHAGHAGASPGGETHYAVSIVSDQFTGMSRVERQRRVYAALSDEFKNGLHALSLKALTTSEASLA